MPPAPQPQQQTFPQQQQQQQQQQQPPVQGYGGQAPNPNQPHPTVPYGQGQQPQGQQQQQQPQGQPQGGQRSDIPDQLILDGAGGPPELRGRTWGQVKQIYGALANDFLLRQNGQRPPQGQQPAPQGRQQQQPPVYVQGQPNGGQPPQDRATSFWENPEATIERIVDSRLAPVTQRTTAMAIQEARQVARAGIPDFDYLEAEMIGIMAGADPNALADPRLWQSTAELARGRLMGRNQYDPRMAQRQQQPNGQQPMQDPRQTRGPGSFVPAPVAPVGQFFTEAPTPPQGGQQYGYDYGQGGQPQITQEEQSYARKMNMTDQEYVAWRGGVIQTAPARRY